MKFHWKAAITGVTESFLLKQEKRHLQGSLSKTVPSSVSGRHRPGEKCLLTCDTERRRRPSSLRPGSAGVPLPAHTWDCCLCTLLQADVYWSLHFSVCFCMQMVLIKRGFGGQWGWLSVTLLALSWSCFSSPLSPRPRHCMFKGEF